jgi:hypothetical protein
MKIKLIILSIVILLISCNSISRINNSDEYFIVKSIKNTPVGYVIVYFVSSINNATFLIIEKANSNNLQTIKEGVHNESKFYLELEVINIIDLIKTFNAPRKEKFKITWENKVSISTENTYYKIKSIVIK